jgi:hypothetical protein
MNNSLKLNVRILDLDRVEEMKCLINELLDTIGTLRLTGIGDCNKGFEISDIEKERKGYINRFADIITDE